MAPALEKLTVSQAARWERVLTGAALGYGKTIPASMRSQGRPSAVVQAEAASGLGWSSTVRRQNQGAPGIHWMRR